MPVELQGFHVVVQVKVGVAQLTVDGAQHLQVFCADLDGRLEEGDPRPVVPGFTEPLALQRQFQARHLHPIVGGEKKKSPKVKNQDKIKLKKPERRFRGSSLGENCLDSGSKDDFLSKSFQWRMLFIFLPASENNGSLGSVFAMGDVASFAHASMFSRFFKSQAEGQGHKVTKLPV